MTKQIKKFRKVVKWVNNDLPTYPSSIFNFIIMMILIFILGLIFSPFILLFKYIELVKETWKDNREVYYEEIK
jgi:hypothetical protein